MIETREKRKPRVEEYCGSYEDEYTHDGKTEEFEVHFKERVLRSTLTSKGSCSGSSRGRIKGFSKKARLRAMKQTARVKKGFFSFRFEFTYPDDVMNGLSIEERAKISAGHLHRLQDWIKRAYPDMGLFWKKEIRPRQSGGLVGEWVFHYHFMAGINGKDWGSD